MNWVLYGTLGPPSAPAPAEDAESAGTDRSVWDYIMYGQRGAPPPPPTPLSEYSGVVVPNVSRIRNLEAVALPSDLALSVSDLSLQTPDGSRQLVSNVSVDVRAGEHLLIMGNSGTVSRYDRRESADSSCQERCGTPDAIPCCPRLVCLRQGKSSMLRAVAGLWDRGSGQILRPLTSHTMFLPQRP